MIAAKKDKKKLDHIIVGQDNVRILVYEKDHPGYSGKEVCSECCRIV